MYVKIDIKHSLLKTYIHVYDKTYTTKKNAVGSVVHSFCAHSCITCITEDRTNNSISCDRKKMRRTDQTSLTSLVYHQPAATVTQTETLMDDRLRHDGAGGR